MLKHLAASVFGAALTAFVSTGPANAQDVKISQDEFHVTEGGSFGGKLLSNMGTKEFVALVTVVCAAFETDCSEEAVAGSRAAMALHSMVEGTDYKITGHIDKQAGEEWYVMFLAPPGYSVCKATAHVAQMSITGESTFNGSIIRDNPGHNGLGIYAVIPKNRSTRQWVDAYPTIMYVREGTEAAHGCWPTKEVLWLCKGQDCKTNRAEARN